MTSTRISTTVWSFRLAWMAVWLRFRSTIYKWWHGGSPTTISRWSIQRPEYSNVNMVEFATASGAKLGHHRIVIRSIEFEGTYITGESLFMILLFVWVVVMGTQCSRFQSYTDQESAWWRREKTSSLEERQSSIERTKLEFSEMLTEMSWLEYLTDTRFVIAWRCSHSMWSRVMKVEHAVFRYWLL